MIRNKKAPYKLSKSRNILTHGHSLYRKKGLTLTPAALKQFEELLQALQEAINAREQQEADKLAREVEGFSHIHFKKTIFDYSKEIVVALLIALVIAIPIRQMWFEFYQIPTGSMRPTFEEGDKLTVSKTSFGINMPLEARHLYFDPSLVRRGGVVIIAGDNLDLPDNGSSYFGIFPYAKRYIKRMIAKPGDSLYFYGGKLWIIDKEGNEIKEIRDAPWMKPLEHVPFLNFNGRVVAGSDGAPYFKQMNQKLGRLALTPTGVQGEILVGDKWVIDDPKAAKKPHDNVVTYSDFYGMGNFGMSRLLTKKEISQFKGDAYKNLPDADLYLEIAHHPSLTTPTPKLEMNITGVRASLVPQKTVIPLSKEHIGRLAKNMYTARFVINGGYANRYSESPLPYTSRSPRFQGVDNGTYEFYNGKGSEIGVGNIAHSLSEESPLYSKNPSNIRKLYNLGMFFDNSLNPKSGSDLFFPNRYVYFKEGDLYTMGGLLIDKDDPALTSFVKQEEARAEKEISYIPFTDRGPPVKNGLVDINLIRTFGVTIPDGYYLVLGDNHAMSADSRDFGFVPEANLQGAPSVIFWPPGARWGFPPQTPYSIFVVPRLIIWAVLLALGIGLAYYYKRKRERQFFKKQKK